MYELRIRRFAQKDLEDIIDYHDSLNTNFTTILLNSIWEELEVISKNPDLFQFRQDEVRVRYIVNYNYGIFYRQFENIVEVIAILHTSRNPEIWKKRY